MKFKDMHSEGQYKSATSAHIRRQSSFPSSIAPSRSFGGVSERPVKKSKKLDESWANSWSHYHGMVGEATDDIKSYDSYTTIPKGTKLRVVDVDSAFVDVVYRGSTINVGLDEFAPSFKPDNEEFQHRLDRVLSRPDVPPIIPR